MGVSFVTELKALIEKIKPSSEDITASVSLLYRLRSGKTDPPLKRIPKSARADLRFTGPCLSCGKDTRYRKCPSHLMYGDSWLDRFFRDWTRPEEIGHQGQDLTLNGKTRFSWGFFMCSDCTDRFAAMNQECSRLYQQRQESSQQKSRDALNAAFRNETLPNWKRFQSLCAVITPEDCEELAALPYRQFLQSAYWTVVKRKALKMADFRCELCNDHGTVDVHHRTYEHHGYEHAYLEDLTCLCRQCHSKFHDKLAESPR